jgi:hypothetical protein
MTILAGIAARARDPSLTHTHYGLAIQDCLQRYLVGKPVAPQEGEPVNPYKVRFEHLSEPAISLTEELNYYRNYGEFGMADLIHELAVWKACELPIQGESFPILEAIAKEHYGLG